MGGDIATVLAVSAAVVLVAVLAVWLISIAVGDVSIIDSFWPIGFVLVAVAAFVVTDGDLTRKAVLLVVTAIWGLRLGGYLFWRWRRTGPDRRYVAMLKRVPGNPHLWALRKVFLLQGALLWVVSLPLQLGQVYPKPDGLTALGVA